jgi:hypothetical protein
MDLLASGLTAEFDISIGGTVSDATGEAAVAGRH